MKKFLVIYILLFAVVLASCGLDNNQTSNDLVSRPEFDKIDDPDLSTDFVQQTALDKIESFDFDGESFVIATTDGRYLSSSANATFLDKAISQRKEAIEKKFNVNITVKVESEAELLDNMRKAGKKGTRYADIVVSSGEVLSILFSEGLLSNLNNIPYVDFSADYIDSSLKNASQINGKLYLLYGDFTQTEYSGWCVFYNKFLAQKIGIDPYDLYKKGEWTKEAFLNYSEKAVQYTKNGFVTTATEADFANALWAMFGEKFFGECSETMLTIPQIENGKDMISDIENVLNHQTYGKICGGDAIKAFIEGESAMVLCRRDAAYQICESGMEWNAVPLPKRDSQSSHRTYIDGEALAVSVPRFGVETDFVGRILNALLAYSKETVSSGIDKNELYYYWADNQTALAMEETKKFGYLDIAIIYAHAVKDIETVTTANIATAIETGIKPFQFYHSTKRQFEIYAQEAFG